ncbi:bifunctional DNA primase/polymerase [Desulfofundulus thermocisternus]|uniref:bifunctional DNA primase/polymerase n=1 Tax=Desulfofundulus thermocisternus TaxID=42471 RepID=UPI00068D3928|nr:bifunctional DNA primase/polymerase [Desulfofundulus thermocisternus]
MLDIVLFYAARGWSIIPLQPRGKRPALASWQEYQSRQATPEEITAWWDRWPDANVGVVTGQVSNLVVLDLDGLDAVNFAKRHGVPLTATVATGKGWHVYFAHPGQPVQNAAGLGGVKGLDVRGDGGYVVAPPSIHPSGRVYRWAKGRSPDDLPLAPCPAWLLEMLANRNRAQAVGPAQEPGWVEALLRGVPEGQRDDACTRLAGHYLGKGLPESEVLALLLAWNQRNQPPLPENQIEKCVRSVASREVRKPARPKTQVRPFRLDGPVYAPEGWRTLVICRNWQEARKLAAAGNAVVVARRDGTLPPEAVSLVAAAEDVKMAGFTTEETRRLAWELYPLRLIRAGAATEGTAALKPEAKPEPAEEVAATESKPAQEPEPAAPPPAEPEPDPAANRFTLECWLNANRPRPAGRRPAGRGPGEAAWWDAEAGFPEKLRAAEAALAQALEAGRQAMQEALAGTEAADRELGFEKVEEMFGGFERVWQLSDAQAARLEAVFQEKGPVVVRTAKNWYSAGEWAERLAGIDHHQPG